MTSAGTSIVTAFDYAWTRFTARVAGLGDDEYLWEPTRDCWSLRRGVDDRWRIDGGDNPRAAEPPPVTTIAWRIAHLGGLALGGFANRLFGTGPQPAPRIDFPADAASAIAFLEHNYAGWRNGLATLDESEWGRKLGARWGLYAESTVTYLALHVFDELVHHAAEIGLLRDLYRERSNSAAVGERVETP